MNNILGVGCSAHIINNGIQHGCDRLPVDVDSVILKIHNYFSIYTVRTEVFKEFCAEADTQYRQLLYHSKTRWLSLYPAIERVLLIYKPLKDYFESLEKPPVSLKQFFDNHLSEAYLFLIHSTMNILHSQIEKLERNDNSILETKKILSTILKSLNDRLTNRFLPFKVQAILKLVDATVREEFQECAFSFYSEIKT